jgi:hypothetical protein
MFQAINPQYRLESYEITATGGIFPGYLSIGTNLHYTVFSGPGDEDF